MYWLTVATFNLWGLAEWKGDCVEPSIGFVQEMCWSKNQHSRIDPILLPRLKYEHVYHTSFSKMRVDLAAQLSCYCYLLFYYNHI